MIQTKVMSIAQDGLATIALRVNSITIFPLVLVPNEHVADFKEMIKELNDVLYMRVKEGGE